MKKISNLLLIVAVVVALVYGLQLKKEGFAQSDAEFGSIVGVTLFVLFFGIGGLAYWAWRN
jgi:protein-S-isoprenylcysteine O-methyltransferase Ste14